MSLRDLWALIKDAFSRWGADNASRLAAALAYYALFSLAPLLIIVIVIAGQVFSQATARAQILAQISSTLGPGGASLVQTMLDNAAKPGSGLVATILSVVTILFGAIGIFGQIHGALNTIWGVKSRADRGLMGMIQDRLLAFAMVLGIGFLFLILLGLSTGLAVVQKYLANTVPGSTYLWRGLNLIVTFAVATLLFAMTYKILSDAIIAWRDLWFGAAVTAFLMTVGNLLIGLYLGRSSAASAYGAAGSLVVLLLWIYYSAQIFFLGAELTQVYATRHGSGIRPGPKAIRALPVTQQPPEKHAAATASQAGDRRPPTVAAGSETGPAPRSLAVTMLLAGIVVAVVAALMRKPRSE